MLKEDEYSEIYDFIGLQRAEQSNRVVGGGCGDGGPEKDDWNGERFH